MKKTVAKTSIIAMVTSLGIASAAATPSTALTQDRVTTFTTAWGQGIVNIGSVYSNKGDYKAAARAHIEEFYGYETESVLFKPTLASEDQFRGTFDEALSYFVGGSIAEDGGFAIAPYTNVRWEKEGTIINDNTAMTMGNYYFTTTQGSEIKVEYTFGLEQQDDGELKIVLHHSSLPFNPS